MLMPITYKGVTYNNYLVRDSDGAIYSRKTNKFLKPTKGSDGYLHVDIYTDDGVRKTVKVHLVTMHTYKPHPNYETMEVNHKKSKDHNGVRDLEWLTPRENIKHAMDTGLRGGVYLSDAKVSKICRDLEDGNTVRKVAEKNKVSIHTVHDIKRKKSYTHISNGYNLNPAKDVR